MTLTALGWTETRNSAFAPLAADGLLPGRVVGEHRTHYRVALETGEVDATAAGRLRNSSKSKADLPGVGDFVAIRPAPGDGAATIEAILPRSTALVRKASGEHRAQLLAANVDVIFIVMALDGDYNLPRLVRYLALVEASGARAVVVANKTDIARDLEAKLAELAAAAPNVPIHAITARASDDIGELFGYFEGDKTVALIGSSGVGKSTLTNRLLQREAQATQAVRSHDDRGRHTTTHRQLFLRAEGGSILDTPGMRGLELWDPDQRGTHSFDDIEALALECRFRNCQHGREPGCAVRGAVERSEMDADRVAAFIEKETAARRKKW